jgi:hypothetical protein
VTSPEQTRAAVEDAFLPAAECLPSASELGVHRRLLAEVDALVGPALRRQLDLLIRVMSSALPSASGVNPMLSPMALADRTATRMRAVA